ncbi:hypothetical protein AXF42_Ash017833 [Apostasia shenzhenica]|uniref:Uncharacterized protein n=1 Tax=Apostasia shenzhenica TaxID=1088818 RepID=A0A2I0A3X3_9ASPA|nr:hypothetical protein AXF42_Ash017833 [Apostasia shenzhenica]
MASFLLPSSFALLFLLSAASASPAANPSPSTDEVPAGGMARVMKEAKNDVVWRNPSFKEMSTIVVLAANYADTKQWSQDGINENLPSAPFAFKELVSVQVSRNGMDGEIMNYHLVIRVTLTVTGIPANSRERLLHGHVRRIGDSPPALVDWYFDNSGVPQGHH